ncbi:MAG: OmpA family protein, partial [Myxococcota bacterium]
IPDYVDYQGGFLGGGCTGCQSGGNGSAPLWLVVVGVACLLRRKETVAVIPAVGFVVLTSVAQAQDVELAAVDARGFWVADTAGDIRRSPRLVYPAVGDVWDAGMLVDMASEPLLEYQPDGVQVVVDTLITTHIYGGYDTGKFRFDASYPFTAYGHDQLGGFAASGDLRLGALWAFMAPDRGKPGVGVQVLSWLPTGTQGRWSGSPGVAAGGVVTLAQEIDRVGYTVNAGVRMGVPNNARNLVTGSSPIGGFEIHYVLPVLDDILAVGGEVAIQGATGFKSWPVEPGMRLRGRLPNGGFAMLGGAMGVGDGVGASKWRGFVGVGFGGIPPEAPPAQGTIVVPVILERIERAASNGPLAELVDNRIVIREQVFFREAKAEILPASQPILAAVAKVLEENPEIEHLLVEGHTNSRASRVYNRKLSQARAEAVAAWLEINGIDGARLIPKGFGEDRPLVKDSHPDAMVINRRVEFTVLRSDESGELNEAPDVKSLPSELQEDR